MDMVNKMCYAAGYASAGRGKMISTPQSRHFACWVYLRLRQKSATLGVLCVWGHRNIKLGVLCVWGQRHASLGALCIKGQKHATLEVFFRLGTKGVKLGIPCVWGQGDTSLDIARLGPGQRDTKPGVLYVRG